SRAVLPAGRLCPPRAKFRSLLPFSRPEQVMASPLLLLVLETIRSFAMRKPKPSSALAAMLCAAALFPIACGRDTEAPQIAERERSTAVEAPAPAQPETPSAAPAVPQGDVELREDRSVEARDQVAAAEREAL